MKTALNEGEIHVVNYGDLHKILFNSLIIPIFSLAYCICFEPVVPNLDFT